ncbi:MAG: hypothetical protein IJO55_01315 [Lachnospiraceae bacterium]|nr:hypothetical protein [Lachnospiraceae bacterium]
MERRKSVHAPKQSEIIGVGGIGKSVGCTHFSIMLVNYLAGYQRETCVLLEWNQTGDLEKMELVCTGKQKEKKPYRVLEVDYYKQSGTKELTDVMKLRYQNIVIDFGDIRDMSYPDFLRCDRQFLIGSFSEWREESFREFVRVHNAGRKNWIYLAAFGSEETRREFRKRPGIMVCRIPFSADAFVVTEETGKFFRKLMKSQNRNH